jgi:hypothetical protein
MSVDRFIAVGDDIVLLSRWPTLEAETIGDRSRYARCLFGVSLAAERCLNHWTTASVCVKICILD